MIKTERRFVFRLSLTAVHVLFWLRQSIALLLLYVWNVGKYVIKHKGTKLESIATDAKQLQKLPSHLGLLVGEEQVSVCDISNVVCWSFATGVQIVSLYDPKGIIINRITCSVYLSTCACMYFTCTCMFIV